MSNLFRALTSGGNLNLFGSGSGYGSSTWGSSPLFPLGSSATSFSPSGMPGTPFGLSSGSLNPTGMPGTSFGLASTSSSPTGMQGTLFNVLRTSFSPTGMPGTSVGPLGSLYLNPPGRPPYGSEWWRSPFERMMAASQYARMTPEQRYQLEHPQAGRWGGQMPADPAVRHMRAKRARLARPNRPQPPWGNQYHIHPYVSPNSFADSQNRGSHGF